MKMSAGEKFANNETHNDINFKQKLYQIVGSDWSTSQTQNCFSKATVKKKTVK